MKFKKALLKALSEVFPFPHNFQETALMWFGAGLSFLMLSLFSDFRFNFTSALIFFCGGSIYNVFSKNKKRGKK